MAERPTNATNAQDRRPAEAAPRTGVHSLLFDARFTWWAAAAALLGMLGLAALARSVIDHPPLYDELLHVLAARGVNETGQPVIVDGIYERAEGFTRLVALSLAAFGDSIVAARLPALAAGMLLVGAVVLWTSMRAGLLAGVAAGAFLAVTPLTVELAVFARFYTLHALAVFAAAVAVWEALSWASAGAPSRARLLAAAGVFAAAALVAGHLQETTVIALGGIAIAGAALALYDRWSGVAPRLRAHPVAIGAGLLAIAGLGLAALWALGLFERLGENVLWASGAADNRNYYNIVLGRNLPLLWPLFPAAALAVLLARPRLGLYCLLLFAVVFVVHSLAAMKAARYLFYALPFLAIVLGTGFALAVGLAARGLQGRARPASAAASRSPGMPAAAPPPGMRAVAAPIAVAALVFGISQEGQLTARWLAAKPSGLEGLSYARESTWSADAVPTLSEAAGAVERIVASAGVKALYYLGDYDYELNVSVADEMGGEFARDYRTGRHAIGSAESVGRVIAEPGTTLVVVDDDKLGDRAGVPDDAVRLLEERCVNLALEPQRLVHGWVCGAGGRLSGAPSSESGSVAEQRP